MTSLPNVEQISQFRDQIVALMGFYCDESKFATLAAILQKRTRARDLDNAQYLNWLSTRPEDEVCAIARELTVTETYFLRNIDQFNALTEIALPERISASNGQRKINLLSAGCASGEEPYSLAITVREHFPHLADLITITAFDLNPSMLQKAARGVYSNWSLRDLSNELKKRWFTVDGDSFCLNESIKKAVHFESHNLSQDAEHFWLPQRFDIIFCRNVLMYFSNEHAQEAVARLAKSLVPGGYLFLGHAETLRGLSNDFHLCHSHQTFYYQRKEHLTEEPLFITHQQKPTVRWQPAASLSADTSWFDAIQLASERIHALRPAPVLVEEPSAPNLQDVIESVRSERYTNSLDQIDELPHEYAADPDVLLLKAVSLCHSGFRAEAQAVCKQLLNSDEFNAGAHYVLALCKEGDGDVDAAAEHDQTAAYLDHQFAMPRLHLGLLSRQKGESSVAQQHLEQALNLLRQEDTSRILLFGGGFKREALINLCRAELASLGARS